MNILIFCIGLSIFVTYMFFLLKMINKAHKEQEEELGPTKEFVKKHKVKKLNEEEWDS